MLVRRPLSSLRQARRVVCSSPSLEDIGNGRQMTSGHVVGSEQAGRLAFVAFAAAGNITVGGGVRFPCEVSQ